MSWQATAYVAEIITNITRSEKLVLMCLSNRHNIDTDEITPSVARLARESIMSVRTCHTALDGLEHKGFISRFARPGTSSEYVISGLSDWIEGMQNLHTSRGRRSAKLDGGGMQKSPEVLQNGRLRSAIAIADEREPKDQNRKKGTGSRARARPLELRAAELRRERAR